MSEQNNNQKPERVEGVCNCGIIVGPDGWLLSQGKLKEAGGPFLKPFIKFPGGRCSVGNLPQHVKFDTNAEVRFWDEEKQPFLTLSYATHSVNFHFMEYLSGEILPGPEMLVVGFAPIEEVKNFFNNDKFLAPNHSEAANRLIGIVDAIRDGCSVPFGFLPLVQAGYLK